jgi:hypothetical protein
VEKKEQGKEITLLAILVTLAHGRKRVISIFIIKTEPTSQRNYEPVTHYKNLQSVKTSIQDMKPGICTVIWFIRGKPDNA